MLLVKYWMQLLLELAKLEQRQIYKRWQELVNLSPSDLTDFLDSEQGKTAGLSRKQASTLNISRGRDSAKAIIRMKAKSVNDWSLTDWEWAKKQISFISRMKGMPGSLVDDKGEPTRKLLSLWVWGHAPNGRKP